MLRHINILWWIFSSLVLWSRANSIENKDLLVSISNGLVRGKENRGLYYSWEGIPYAEPPTGNLRFEAPQPYQRHWNDIYDATKTAPNCMQWDQFQKGENKTRGIEDCLTVSIYRPIAKVTDNYPVLVFIHGGSFMFGGVRIYDAERLMNSDKLLLVKIAYRLGPLGFLSTEDESITGNFGLKDQQMALQWIKENIEKFGGNPEKILLTGFSAGGASTHLHMLQAPEKNVAKAAVSFSGVALNPWVLHRNAREKAIRVGSLVNCSPMENTQDLKDCLKQQNAEDIVATVKDFQNIAYNPFSVFGPVIEHQNASGAFLTQHPRDIIKSGKFIQIPWLASQVADEGGYNAAELMRINPQTGRELIYDFNDNWLEFLGPNMFLDNFRDDVLDCARALKQKYLGEANFTVENYMKFSNMCTDILFKDGIYESLQMHSKYSKAPVYGYIYDNPAVSGVGQGLAERNDIYFGTVHMDDLTLFLSTGNRNMTDDEEIIAQKFVHMLIDFIEDGKLSFGDCDFVNNAAENVDYLKILSITRQKCETITIMI
ncbi:esterase-5B-like [Haematobia irritans]|uniref:esterase-5B-like n=1 Tax=Haematobia irritans TaxID=7368 RepID=UPI003F4FEEC7